MKYLLIISFLFLGLNLNAQKAKQAPTTKKQVVEKTKMMDCETVKKDNQKLQAKYNLMKEMFTDKTYLSNLNKKEKEYLMKNIDDVIDIDKLKINHRRGPTRRMLKKECKPFN